MKETFDFILAGGTLLLPGGPVQADVGVRAGRTVAIGDLGASENGQERALGVVEHGGEGVEFLLHEEAGDFGKIYADDGGMRTVGCAEGVAHEEISELGEAGAEGGDFFGVGLCRGAILIFYFALFFDVEAEVLEENDLAGL